jgi:hypothetical protein
MSNTQEARTSRTRLNSDQERQFKYLPRPPSPKTLVPRFTSIPSIEHAALNTKSGSHGNYGIHSQDLLAHHPTLHNDACTRLPHHERKKPVQTIFCNYCCYFADCRGRSYSFEASIRGHLNGVHGVEASDMKDAISRCQQFASDTESTKSKEDLTLDMNSKHSQKSLKYVASNGALPFPETSASWSMSTTGNQKYDVRIKDECHESLHTIVSAGGDFEDRHTDSTTQEGHGSPHSTFTAVHSTRSCGSESDNLEIMDGSSDDCEVDCAKDIAAQKDHILNHLMVHVYAMFSSAGSTNEHGHRSTSSSSPPKQAGGPSNTDSKSSAGKRSRDEANDCNRDDDENDKSDKRRRIRNGSSNIDFEKIERRLACPYYKRDPQKGHLSGACCGPGWDSVHRIKYGLNIVVSDRVKLILSQRPPIPSTRHATSLQTLLHYFQRRIFTD